MGACKVPPISCFLLPTPPNCKTPIPIRQKLNPSSPNRRGLLISTSSLLVVLLPPPTCSSALPTFDPVSPNERDASADVSQRVSEAVSLLEKGRELQAQGDFERALQYFTQVRLAPEKPLENNNKFDVVSHQQHRIFLSYLGFRPYSNIVKCYTSLVNSFLCLGGPGCYFTIIALLFSLFYFHLDGIISFIMMFYTIISLLT